MLTEIFGSSETGNVATGTISRERSHSRATLSSGLDKRFKDPRTILPITSVTNFPLSSYSRGRLDESSFADCIFNSSHPAKLALEEGFVHGRLSRQDCIGCRERFKSLRRDDQYPRKQGRIESTGAKRRIFIRSILSANLYESRMHRCRPNPIHSARVWSFHWYGGRAAVVKNNNRGGSKRAKNPSSRSIIGGGAEIS